jgi:hypothetical protein
LEGVPKISAEVENKQGLSIYIILGGTFMHAWNYKPRIGPIKKGIKVFVPFEVLVRQYNIR